MSLRVIPARGRRRQLLSAFRLLSSRVSVRPGCVYCGLNLDEAKRDIVYLEIWSSWQQLEEHVRSELFLHLLQLMEASASGPELSFESPEKTCGLEWVQSVRNQNESIKES